MAKETEQTVKVEAIQENIKRLSKFLEGKGNFSIKPGVDLAGVVKKLKERREKRKHGNGTNT